MKKGIKIGLRGELSQDIVNSGKSFKKGSNLDIMRIASESGIVLIGLYDSLNEYNQIWVSDRLVRQSKPRGNKPKGNS